MTQPQMRSSLRHGAPLAVHSAPRGDLEGGCQGLLACRTFAGVTGAASLPLETGSCHAPDRPPCACRVVAVGNGWIQLDRELPFNCGSDLAPFVLVCRLPVLGRCDAEW